MKRKQIASGIAAAVIVLGVPLVGAGEAGAQTTTGWIGPLQADGINYLHTSTINNAPLTASSRIYTVDGNEVPPGYIGVRARLFKSEALCEATVYKYNADPSPSQTNATTQKCGSGSYNSHGYVAAYVGADGGYTETFTFPTNPLNYTQTAARSAPSSTVETGKNSRGQTFGSADSSSTAVPDLVAAIATNGRQGYISSDALNQRLPKNPSEALTNNARPAPTVTVYEKDGTTAIGQFTFG